MKYMLIAAALFLFMLLIQPSYGASPEALVNPSHRDKGILVYTFLECNNPGYEIPPGVIVLTNTKNGRTFCSNGPDVYSFNWFEKEFTSISRYTQIELQSLKATLDQNKAQLDQNKAQYESNIKTLSDKADLDAKRIEMLQAALKAAEKRLAELELKFKMNPPGKSISLQPAGKKPANKKTTIKGKSKAQESQADK